MNQPDVDPNRRKRLAGQVLLSMGVVLGLFSLLGFLFESGGPSDILYGVLGSALIAAAPLVAGILLLRRAGTAPGSVTVAPGELAPLSGLRIFFVVLASLVLLFSGGCGLLFLGSYLVEPSSQNYITPMVVLIFAGPPFIIGLVILLLALRAGRKRGSTT